MFISPMLLETAATPFSDSRYIFEPKIDGHRLIYSQIDGNVRLYTRHNNECTRQYPEINGSNGALFPHNIVLDGEIACVDPTSNPLCRGSKRNVRIKYAGLPVLSPSHT